MPPDEANIFDDDFLVRLEHVRLQMSKRFAGTLRAERRSRGPLGRDGRQARQQRSRVHEHGRREQT